MPRTSPSNQKRCTQNQSQRWAPEPRFHNRCRIHSSFNLHFTWRAQNRRSWNQNEARKLTKSESRCEKVLSSSSFLLFDFLLLLLLKLFLLLTSNRERSDTKSFLWDWGSDCELLKSDSWEYKSCSEEGIYEIFDLRRMKKEKAESLEGCMVAIL